MDSGVIDWPSKSSFFVRSSLHLQPRSSCNFPSQTFSIIQQFRELIQFACVFSRQLFTLLLLSSFITSHYVVFEWSYIKPSRVCSKSKTKWKNWKFIVKMFFFSTFNRARHETRMNKKPNNSSLWYIFCFLFITFSNPFNSTNFFCVVELKTIL